MEPAEYRTELRCHPSTRSETVRGIHVLVRRSASAELKIGFSLYGDIPLIRLPSPGVPRIATQLWQHTCFEAFIAVDGQSAYHEFNFAPSGEWALYSFCSYRGGRSLANEAKRPHIEVSANPSQLKLDALIQLSDLSAFHPRASLRIGLSAIVETSDGLSYWALRHLLDKPDFHQADGFTLLLNALDPEG